LTTPQLPLAVILFDSFGTFGGKGDKFAVTLGDSIGILKDKRYSLENRGLLMVNVGFRGEDIGLMQTGWPLGEKGVIFITVLGDPVVVSIGDSFILAKLIGGISRADFEP
jgi:hypothetical protein